MDHRKKNVRWLVIIGIAMIIHLALFLWIRPDFFSAFKKSVAQGENVSEPFAGIPDAIITILIEIDEESDVPEPEPKHDTETPTPQEKKKTTESKPPASGGPVELSLDNENLIGESPQTLPHSVEVEAISIPPRPVEITWPDTRKLKHCLGHHIDIRIEVSESGEILQIDALPDGHPRDCVEAAVGAARRIVFEPGRVDGAPTQMWTQVRIDFKRKE